LYGFKFRLAAACKHDGGAVLGERDRSCAANSRAGAGDDGDFAGQFKRIKCLHDDLLWNENPMVVLTHSLNNIL
jgi:hypothetical protein